MTHYLNFTYIIVALLVSVSLISLGYALFMILRKSSPGNYQGGRIEGHPVQPGTNLHIYQPPFVPKRISEIPDNIKNLPPAKKGYSTHTRKGKGYRKAVEL